VEGIYLVQDVDLLGSIHEYSFKVCTIPSDMVKALNVKVKITLEQATKAQRGSRVIVLLFL
jgi:hypothetical protein